MPIAIGMFGIAELAVSLGRPQDRSLLSFKLSNLWPSRAEMKQSFPAMVRGTALGCVLGVLPGGGAALSSFAAYALEKKSSRQPQRFGRGAVEGVAAPEAANNAGAQASFIPLLTLGHSRQRHHGADDRRHDDPGHPARPAGDDRRSRNCSGA